MDQLKTSIRRRASRNRRGVLIKREKSSANTEPGEDGRAVPAAAKGAIDVDSAGTDSQGSDGFFEKDRDMGDLAHGGEKAAVRGRGEARFPACGPRPAGERRVTARSSPSRGEARDFRRR